MATADAVTALGNRWWRFLGCAPCNRRDGAKFQTSTTVDEGELTETNYEGGGEGGW